MTYSPKTGSLLNEEGRGQSGLPSFRSSRIHACLVWRRSRATAARGPPYAETKGRPLPACSLWSSATFREVLTIFPFRGSLYFHPNLSYVQTQCVRKIIIVINSLADIFCPFNTWWFLILNQLLTKPAADAVYWKNNTFYDLHMFFKLK